MVLWYSNLECAFSIGFLEVDGGVKSCRAGLYGVEQQPGRGGDFQHWAISYWPRANRHAQAKTLRRSRQKTEIYNLV